MQKNPGGLKSFVPRYTTNVGNDLKNSVDKEKNVLFYISRRLQSVYAQEDVMTFCCFVLVCSDWLINFDAACVYKGMMGSDVPDCAKLRRTS